MPLRRMYSWPNFRSDTNRPHKNPAALKRAQERWQAKSALIIMREWHLYGEMAPDL
jgi:hypothetical protein